MTTTTLTAEEITTNVRVEIEHAIRMRGLLSSDPESRRLGALLESRQSALELVLGWLLGECSCRFGTVIHVCEQCGRSIEETGLVVAGAVRA